MAGIARGDRLGEDVIRLREDFSGIRGDLEALSGRLSIAVDDVMQGMNRLRDVDRSLDELFRCAAVFARSTKTTGAADSSTPAEQSNLAEPSRA
jgi:hypothetical protein